MIVIRLRDVLTSLVAIPVYAKRATVRTTTAFVLTSMNAVSVLAAFAIQRPHVPICQALIRASASLVM